MNTLQPHKQPCHHKTSSDVSEGTREPSEEVIRARLHQLAIALAFVSFSESSDLLSIIPTKTEGLEDENQGSNPYEYQPIDPTSVWFNPGGGVVEGQAIAANGKGMMRITWGEERASDVPRDRVYMSDPTTTAVSLEVEAKLASMGLEVCAPSITPEESKREMCGEANPTLRPVQANGLVEERPVCSRWEPEEVDQVARIQLQGLLKHLEPAELVKAAIVHSGVSLVDAVRVAVEMSNFNEGEQMLELIKNYQFDNFPF
ncbi:MAG: hypothetical protein KME45_02900 [Stenomitos rutilans HA7619-LM2]|jgi:hypothetical protein|nr:hypothetical protein [Stenomitos rutilans HA7619-LM2]MBW4469332.1 hypothetical protein [Stenomitos rutilans HA7619-LM2]